MENLQEYKCPCCGGAVVFDSSLQKMKCPYCDTEFEIDALKEYSQEVQSQQADEMNWEMPTGSQWKEGEEEGLRSYICKSCGGEIVGDENMAAAACPFCGNSVIITQQFAGALRPDCVIPFKLVLRCINNCELNSQWNPCICPTECMRSKVVLLNEASDTFLQLIYGCVALPF